MSNHEPILDAITRCAGGDSAAFVALLADDVTWTTRGTTTWSGSFHGRADVLAMLRTVNSFYDARWRATVGRVIAGGDTLAIELVGNNQLRDGRRYDNQYCWIVRHAGGMIRELIEYGDTALIERVLPPYTKPAEAR
jgi:ketosteroid isomerase-like protein